MFYEIKLLCPQKEGIFAISWKAAYLGVKKLSRSEILNTDIVKTSYEIETMMMSKSSRKKDRLSLRLAIVLVNGTIKILHEQVVILLDSVIHFSSQKHTLIGLHHRLPRKGSPKPKKIQKKVKKTAPEASVAIPTEEELRAITHVHIETTSAIAEEAERQKSFAQGPPELGDELMRKIEELSGLNLQEVQVEVHTKEREVTPKVVEITQAEEVVGQLEEIKISEEGIREIPQQEDIVVEKERTPKKKKDLKEDDIAVHESPKKKRRLTGERRREVLPENIPARKLVQINQRSVKKINRCEPGTFETVSLWNLENIQPHLIERLNPEPLNVTPFLEDFYQYDPEYLAKKASTGRPTQTSQSTLENMSPIITSLVHKRSRTKSPRVVVTTPDQEIVEVVGGEQLQEQLPTQKERSTLGKLPAIIETEIEPSVLSETAPDVVHEPIAEAEFKKPPPKIRSKDVSPVPSDDSEKRRRTEENRQHRLVKIIKKWNEEIDGEITIEKICPTPITRRTISQTFGDLLVLSKLRYVKLHNKPNSIELGRIEKAEKLLK